MNWSVKEFLDRLAIGQVTPGPITITATLLGCKLFGFMGAGTATLAIFSPAFFIGTPLIPIATAYKKCQLCASWKAYSGLISGTLGLVLYIFGKSTFVDFPSVTLTPDAFIGY